MRLTSAPGPFQKLKKLVFSGFSHDVALIYLGDKIFWGKTFEERIERLDQKFRRLKKIGFRIKKTKCELLLKGIHFLAHAVSEKEVEENQEKVAAVRKVKSAFNMKNVKAVLRLVGFYRKFFSEFRKKLRTSLPTTEEGEKFSLDKRGRRFIARVDRDVLTALILGYPNKRDE